MGDQECDRVSAYEEDESTMPRRLCHHDDGEERVPSILRQQRSSLQPPQSHAPAVPVANSTRRHMGLVSLSPNPFINITRLRVHTQAHHCLYPGASFQGTQKSGWNSCDVTVTTVVRRRLFIVFTTYFDADVIDSRYGFRTQNGGTNEADNMVHWSRFPAFRHVKHDLKRPHYTIPDRDQGAVFMRWKERFLVPDHRVQDIMAVCVSLLQVLDVLKDEPKTDDDDAKPNTKEMLETTRMLNDVIVCRAHEEKGYNATELVNYLSAVNGPSEVHPSENGDGLLTTPVSDVPRLVGIEEGLVSSSANQFFPGDQAHAPESVNFADRPLGPNAAA
ncbi:vacuolar import and degradation protein-domain-containing protein [Armillaria novae-zelandiae]|uniref:Vacuolar import and degradation protein-domain-containing protein n=1 Tax=Armillaria novae-zelandiae TaxID=153914 RepID=A0AA39ND73_9AGAR|nr:vacuolar import and degradation protein-domain-containing protein [Armillaria novae-zelandiae]